MPEATARKSDEMRPNIDSQVTQKPSLRLIVTSLKEKAFNSTVPKATSIEPARPLSAHQLSHDGHEHHENHPHHAHTMVDDHMKVPIDHKCHWSQLLAAKKPHKKNIEEKAKETMQHLLKHDSIIDISERLKEDDALLLKEAALMSRTAGIIASATEHQIAESDAKEQRRKPFLRTAKSMKRDAAIDKLAKVMNEQHRSKGAVEMMEEQEDNEQTRKEEPEQQEEQEEDESWKMLTFDESPARRRERRDTYSVITQRRKPSRPHTPVRERKGEHPLDLIGVFEVQPHTPRTQSVERNRFTETITVHASDFIKYGDDIEMLKALKVESPSTSEPLDAEDLQKSKGDGKQSGSRRRSCNGSADLEVLSVLHGRRASGSLPGSRPSSQPPCRPGSRPFSARRSRPEAARPFGDTWPPSQPPSRPTSGPSSARASSLRAGRRYKPFLPLQGQSM